MKNVTLTENELATLRLFARLGYTQQRALAQLSRRINADKCPQLRSISFRKSRRARAGGWLVDIICRHTPDADRMTRREMHRESARLRYRITVMGMTPAEAMRRPLMSASERGRIGGLRKAGKPLVSIRDGDGQKEWNW